MAAPAAETTGGTNDPVLLTDVTDRVGTITLNRPERRNALNGELIGALDDAVRAMAENAEVKVVVLTGAAPPGGLGGFCSGGDVKDGAAGPGGDHGVPVDALTGDLARHDDHAAMRTAPDAQAHDCHGGRPGHRRRLQSGRRLRPPLRLGGRRVLGQLHAQRAGR